MKYTLRVELEVGDTIRLYDETRDRGLATVIRAGPYREREDVQRLVVNAGIERLDFDGRIEHKAAALGYDNVPVLAVWFA